MLQCHETELYSLWIFGDFFLKPQVWAGGLLDQAGLAQGVVWLHITDMCASGRVGWRIGFKSNTTRKSNCHHPGHFAGLLSLSSKRQTTTVVEQFWALACFSCFCCDQTVTHWRLDRSKPRTADRERKVYGTAYITHFQFWVVPPKMIWPVKNWCDFFFFLI